MADQDDEKGSFDLQKSDEKSLSGAVPSVKLACDTVNNSHDGHAIEDTNHCNVKMDDSAVGSFDSDMSSKGETEMTDVSSASVETATKFLSIEGKCVDNQDSKDIVNAANINISDASDSSVYESAESTPAGQGDHGTEKEESSLPLGNMKKDDSGIDIEKSPIKEGASSDESENSTKPENNVAKVKSAEGTRNRTISQASNDSEGLVRDFEDIEESEVMGQDNDSDTRDTHDTRNDTPMSEEDHTSETGSDKADDTRRKKCYTESNSSNSSDVEDDHDDDAETKSAKSEHDDEEMDIDTDMPKDKWQVIHELRKLREHGYSNRHPQSQIFRRKTTSSLRMLQRLKLQFKMQKHDGCVNALQFNQSGSMLASGSDDLNVVLWNWAANKPMMVFDSGHRSNVFQSKFMPNSGDCNIVTCARDGQVRLAELSMTGVCKSTKKLAQHRGSAHKLALLEDSSHMFLSCGEDAVVYEVDLREDKPNKLCTTKENERKVALYSIHTNPMRSYEYCVGGRDHFIRIYDKRMINEEQNGGTLKKFCPHHLLDSDIKANVTCAVYNYNGTEVLGTYNDEDIYLFDASHSDGAEFIHRYKGHRNNATVKGVNFYGPHSEYIISGSDCSNVFLWEKESEKVVQYFHADEGGVINVLEPHPHAPVLATSGLDSDVKIWAPTAEEATNLEGLKQIMRKNRRERAEERNNEPEMIDGQMLWFLMHHLRRTARQRARREGEDLSSSSNSDSESSDSEDVPEPMQCAPS